MEVGIYLWNGIIVVCNYIFFYNGDWMLDICIYFYSEVNEILDYSFKNCNIIFWNDWICVLIYLFYLFIYIMVGKSIYI